MEARWGKKIDNKEDNKNITKITASSSIPSPSSTSKKDKYGHLTE